MTMLTLINSYQVLLCLVSGIRIHSPRPDPSNTTNTSSPTSPPQSTSRYYHNQSQILEILR